MFLVQYLGGTERLVENLKLRESGHDKDKRDRAKGEKVSDGSGCWRACYPKSSKDKDPNSPQPGDMTLAELDAHEKGESPAVANKLNDGEKDKDKEEESEEPSPEVLEARRRDPHAGEQRHLFPCKFCCRKPLTPRFFLWNTQWGALQYVPIQIVCSILTFILHFTGNYHDGVISASDGYPYIAFVINCSQIWAVYCLFWFYHSFRDELKTIRPFPKAMCIKGVVFLTFWQGVFISVLVYYDVLQATENYSVEEVATGLQDFLICLEMFIAAVAHERFFGVRDWEDKMVNDQGRVVPKLEVGADSPKHGPRGPVLSRFMSFISPRDIGRDLKAVMIKTAPKNRNSVDGTNPSLQVSGMTVQSTPITSSSSESSAAQEASLPIQPTVTSTELE